MQPYLPANYIPNQNRRPNLLCKVFLTSVHLHFSLNNPPLLPSIWEINNIVTLLNIFCAFGWFRNPYVSFISFILFKSIIEWVSFIIYLMFYPTVRISVITYLTILELHCLQNIISHSMNQILIWYLSLQYICTLCSKLYQSKNIIFIISIDKGIITRRERFYANEAVIFSSGIHTAPHLSEIYLKIVRLWTN